MQITVQETYATYTITYAATYTTTCTDTKTVHLSFCKPVQMAAGIV
jgi:hypothetical protein